MMSLKPCMIALNNKNLWLWLCFISWTINSADPQTTNAPARCPVHVKHDA